MTHPDQEGMPPALALRFTSALVHWAPVGIALALFAQLALLGMKPALAERERLREAGERLETRLAADEEEHARLSAFRRALDDPVYRERLRLQRQGSTAVGDE
jgi:hypothetical protein